MGLIKHQSIVASLLLCLGALAWSDHSIGGYAGAYWACQNSSDPINHASDPITACRAKFGSRYPEVGILFVDGNGYRVALMPLVNGSFNYNAGYKTVHLKLCPSGRIWVEGVGCSSSASPDYPRVHNSGPLAFCDPRSGGTNPIDITTGSKHHREAIFGAVTNQGLAYSLHYDSHWGGWKPAYGSKLLVFRNDEYHPLDGADKLYVNQDMAYVGSDGTTVIFNNLDPGQFGVDTRAVWHSFPNVAHRLDSIVNGSTGQIEGYVLTKPDGSIERFDAQGILTSGTTVDAVDYYVQYDSSGKIGRVFNQFGYSLDFTYVAGEATDKWLIALPDGRSYALQWSSTGLLLSVTYPDDTPDDAQDNPAREFLYEDAAFPQRLTGIVDERGVRTATWSYDAQGRAISSGHADGVDRYTLSFHPDDTTTVVDPMGHQRIYGFSSFFGRNEITTVTGGPCDLCGGNFTTRSYDANGFLASQTALEGRVTTYLRDERGRQVSRTEAAGTPEARTITTTWHATLRKPLQVVEPGKITTYTYDAAGRLLSRQEQTSW